MSLEPPSREALRQRSHSSPCCREGASSVLTRLRDNYGSSSLVSALSLEFLNHDADGTPGSHFELAQMIIKRIMDELSILSGDSDSDDSDEDNEKGKEKVSILELLFWPSLLSQLLGSITSSCPSGIKESLETKASELFHLLEERKLQMYDKASQLGHLKDDTLLRLSKKLEDKSNDLSVAWDALPSFKSLEDSGAETLAAFRKRRDSALESLEVGLSGVLESLSAGKDVLMDKGEDARSMLSEVTGEMRILLSAFVQAVATTDPSGSFSNEDEVDNDSGPSTRLLDDLPSMETIKEYFLAESQRLSALLPTPPGYEDAAKYARALKEGAKRMLHFHELPSEWQHNPFIRSGYRFVPAENWGTLFAGGVFGLHNETLNIHTHLFGAVSVVIVLLSLYWNVFSFPSFMTPAAQTERTLLDFVIASFFLLAATYCFLCSCLFHILSHCSSRTYYYFGANLDYLGISLLISASVISYIHFCFYCAPLWIPTMYMGSMFILGMIGCALPFLGGGKWFNDLSFKPYRIAFFLGLAACSVAPLCHGAWLYGAGETWEVFRPILPSISSYLAGLFFYASNYPEKLFPGGICNYVHSHNLWHLGIIGGVYLHWIALIYIEHFGKESYSCKIR